MTEIDRKQEPCNFKEISVYFYGSTLFIYDTIWYIGYDTIAEFNVASKAARVQLNLAQVARHSKRRN